MTAPEQLVTDGGLETDLIFHHGVDLPDFAAFPLLGDERGRDLLAATTTGTPPSRERAGAGLLLETPTWRANPDWGARLGYDAAALAAVNRRRGRVPAARSRDALGRPVADVRVSGMVGPRGDGYVAGERSTPTRPRTTTAPQVAAFAEAGADLVTALTLTDAGEAIGVVRGRARRGLPVAVGFTVETDGRLPDGTTLRRRDRATSTRTGAAGVLPGQLRPPDPRRARPRRRRRLARAHPRPPGQRLDAEPRRARRGRPSSTTGDPTELARRPRPAGGARCRRSASSAAAAAPTPATSPRCGETGQARPGCRA